MVFKFSSSQLITFMGLELNSDQTDCITVALLKEEVVLCQKTFLD